MGLTGRFQLTRQAQSLGHIAQTQQQRQTFIADIRLHPDVVIAGESGGAQRCGGSAFHAAQGVYGFTRRIG